MWQSHYQTDNGYVGLLFIDVCLLTVEENGGISIGTNGTIMYQIYHHAC